MWIALCRRAFNLAKAGYEEAAMREATSMINNPTVATYYHGISHRLRGDLRARGGNYKGAIEDYANSLKLLDPDYYEDEKMNINETRRRLELSTKLEARDMSGESLAVPDEDH